LPARRGRRRGGRATTRYAIVAQGEALEQAQRHLLAARWTRLPASQQFGDAALDPRDRLAAGLALHPVDHNAVDPAGVRARLRCRPADGQLGPKGRDGGGLRQPVVVGDQVDVRALVRRALARRPGQQDGARRGVALAPLAIRPAIARRRRDSGVGRIPALYPLAGVSRQRVWELSVVSEDFPKPAAVLGTGRV
jgi:hypothetical protein